MKLAQNGIFNSDFSQRLIQHLERLEVIERKC